MHFGVPKEIKNSERRVALTPAGVAALVAKGHAVHVEHNAGEGSGFPMIAYFNAGAIIHASAADVWAESDLILKVKEPIGPEWDRIKKGQVIFTYFHLAANPQLTLHLLSIGATCIAYETVQLASGELPLLTPMSEVAGRLAVQKGAYYLDVVLGGVTGVPPASVVIIGGGVVGSNAAKSAIGLGASVVILDTLPQRLEKLAKEIPGVRTVLSTRESILEHIAHADLVVGAVLIAGKKAPKLILKDDLKLMKKGAVIVGVDVDQDSCVETLHATTHDDPVYPVDGIIHYGVANMPGAVPGTSTLALTNATLPYIMAIADKGWKKALADDEALRKGLNICDGHVTHRGVADAFNMSFEESEKFL